MTNSEINALAARVKMGDVWWYDGNGTIKRVRAVDLEKPLALLIDGISVELKAARVSEFVTLQPAVRPGA